MQPNPSPHKLSPNTQKLYARNPYLLSNLSQIDQAASEKVITQFSTGNPASLSLVQWRGLFVYVLQIAVLGTEHDNMKEKEKEPCIYVNIRSILVSSTKLFLNRYSSSFLAENSLDHNNIKCLRCIMYLVTSLFDIYANCIDSTESIESLETFLKFSVMLLNDVTTCANAVGIKEKDRERLTLYCRTLGIIGSSFLIGRHSKDPSIQGKKIRFCQDIVQGMIGTTATATATAAAVITNKGSSNNNRGAGTEGDGLLKGYLHAVQATALASGTATLQREKSFNAQKKSFSLGLGLGVTVTKDAVDAKNIRQVMVPTAMLSTLRRILFAAASTGVARRSGNGSSGGGGMLAHETLLAAISSGHPPLCQHATSIVTCSLATQKIQVEVDRSIVPGGDSVIALAAKLKSRLLCIDFRTSTSAEDLNTMLTATYILRAIAVLVRVRVEDLGQVDVETSIVDILGCVTQLLKKCSNLKVFIEAATVLIGEHQQQDTPCHFLSNWHLVRLTEQYLLSQFNEHFISGFLTPLLLQHMKTLFESNNTKEKYLQPLLLRFISRVGRFLIVRPSDSPKAWPAESPYLIGESLLHPLWTILKATTLSCMEMADEEGAIETEEIFGQAIIATQDDLKCPDLDGQGAQLLEQLVSSMIWIAPDHRYSEKDHKELWSSFSKIILRSLYVLSSPAASQSLSPSALAHARSYSVICNLFERIKASTVQDRKNGRSKHIVCYCKEYVDLLLAAVEKHVQCTLTCYSAGVQAIAIMEQIWHWLSLFFSPVQRANAEIRSSDILTNLSISSLKTNCETHCCEALLASILRVLNGLEVPARRRSNLDTQHKKKILSQLQMSSAWAMANYAPSFVLFPLRDTKNGNVIIESVQETVVNRLESLAKYECDLNIQKIAIQGLAHISDAVSSLYSVSRNLPLLSSSPEKNSNNQSSYHADFNSQEVEALSLRVLFALARLWSPISNDSTGSGKPLGDDGALVEDLIVNSLPAFGNRLVPNGGEFGILRCLIRRAVVATKGSAGSGPLSLSRDSVPLSVLKLLQVVLKVSSSLNVTEMIDTLLIDEDKGDEASSVDPPYARFIYDPWVTNTSKDSPGMKVTTTPTPVKPAKPSPTKTSALVDLDSWPLSMGTESSLSPSVASTSTASIFLVDQFSPQMKKEGVSLSSPPVAQDVFLNPLDIFDATPSATITSSSAITAASFPELTPIVSNSVPKSSPLDSLWATPAPAAAAIVDRPNPPTTDAFDENLSAAFAASSTTVDNVKANSKEIDDFAPSVAGSGSPDNAYYASQYTIPQPMHYPAQYPSQYPLQYSIQYPMPYPPLAQQPPHPNLNPSYYPNNLNPNPGYGVPPNSNTYHQYPTYLPPSEKIDKDNPFQ